MCLRLCVRVCVLFMIVFDYDHMRTHVTSAAFHAILIDHANEFRILYKPPIYVCLWIYEIAKSHARGCGPFVGCFAVFMVVAAVIFCRFRGLCVIHIRCTMWLTTIQWYNSWQRRQTTSTGNNNNNNNTQRISQYTATKSINNLIETERPNTVYTIRPT